MTQHSQEHLDLVFLYTLQVLPASEVPGVEAQISTCKECLQEVESLRPIIGSLVAWPTDVLRPSGLLWQRLAKRIAAETGKEALLSPPEPPVMPEWEEVAAGISCKILATDTTRNRVSMLVRLTPGAEYPPHRHAGIEELHLLQGELMIDEKKLYPGDYIRAEADSMDHRVWSETGCTCVLLTSTEDVLL